MPLVVPKRDHKNSGVPKSFLIRRKVYWSEVGNGTAMGVKGDSWLVPDVRYSHLTGISG